MLKCTTCGKTVSWEKSAQRCECGEPLEVELQTGTIHKGASIWERFREFYPFPLNVEDSLGEGDTPLSRARKLSEKLDVTLYLKNETMNPTWSFKDRGTFVGVHRAFDLGFERIGTVSTGNMAASVAAYGSRFDLETTILVSAGLSKEKLIPIMIHTPNVVKVQGDYGRLYYRSLEIGNENGIYFINSDDPFRIEGYKTISYEIIEELVPDYVIIPSSSGGLFRGITKGFLELRESGIITTLPTFVCAQAAGCSPICKAFQKGKKEVNRIEQPHTIAHAIENPDPPSGNTVLRKLQKYNGECITIQDEDILDTQKEIAREGIFVQPASTVSVAALKKLRAQSTINANTQIVCILTGAGLKVISDTQEIKKAKICTIKELDQCI